MDESDHNKCMSLNTAIELYKKVGRRTPYLFEWLYNIYSKTRLSCVDPKYNEELALTKQN